MSLSAQTVLDLRKRMLAHSVVGDVAVVVVTARELGDLLDEIEDVRRLLAAAWPGPEERR